MTQDPMSPAPSAPEPTDVGPLVGGDQRLSDQDRRLVIDLLTAAHHDGRLGDADFNTRFAAAQRARTFDDMTPLTRDLMAAPIVGQGFIPGQGGAPLGLAGSASSLPSSSSQKANLVSIFASTTRKGVWRAPAEISAVGLFGSVEIDLTQAVWTSPVIEITVATLFAGVTIKAPADTEIVRNVAVIFGSVDEKRMLPPSGQRRIVIKGFACFSGVDIKGM